MNRSFELNASISDPRTLREIDTSDLDGVYLGQPYCLKYRDNFILAEDALRAAIHRLHGEGKKAYLTTPAIPTSAEFPRLIESLSAAAELGIDAIEAHDVGVFRWVRRELPEVVVHVGNFANTYNEDSAAIWGRLGATRVVPSHELTGDELQIITAANKTLQFERPVHGPLPLGMAYSCLLRRDLPDEVEGPCHQQCADPHYLELDDWGMRCVGTSLLSGEDYCLMEHIGDLAARGVTAFRLETCFDPAAKINVLIKLYRSALDAVMLQSPDEIDEQTVAMVRELAPKGLCNGWHFGRSGRDYVGAGDSCVG